MNRSEALAEARRRFFGAAVLLRGAVDAYQGEVWDADAARAVASCGHVHVPGGLFPAKDRAERCALRATKRFHEKWADERLREAAFADAERRAVEGR